MGKKQHRSIKKQMEKSVSGLTTKERQTQKELGKRKKAGFFKGKKTKWAYHSYAKKRKREMGKKVEWGSQYKKKRV